VSEHTPGPWKVSQRVERNGFGTLTFQEIVVGEPGRQYAQCLNLIDGDGQDHSARNKRALADARLIAAAPELLEALQDCVTVLGEMVIDLCPNGDDTAKATGDKGLAAIAKATGK